MAGIFGTVGEVILTEGRRGDVNETRIIIIIIITRINCSGNGASDGLVGEGTWGVT